MTRKRKLGFDFFMDETPLFLKVAELLNNQFNVEVRGVTLGKRWKKDLSMHPSFRTWDIERFLKENWNHIDISKHNLSKLEQKYGPKPLNLVIYADKYFVKSVHGKCFDHEFILRMLAGHFLFWEKYAEQSDIDAFMGPGIQGLFDMTRLRVMNRLGIPNLSLYSTRHPTGRFVFCRNERDSWDKVRDRFEWLKINTLPPEERINAEEYLMHFREARSMPDYMKDAWKQLGIKSHFIAEFLKRFKGYYIEGNRPSKYDFVTPEPIHNGYTKGLRVVVKKAYQKHLGYFEYPVPGEEFVFFPLHFQPEASTLVLSPYFVDQLAVVENIAKSIPVYAKLYVKEHISSFGRRPIGYYRALKKLPNVRIISPLADSHALINQSIVNVVITSTVGWESLLYERPVVVLGDVFYNDSGLSHRVSDFMALPNAIKEAAKNDCSDFEALIKFISSIFYGSYQGKFAVPHHDPSVMNYKNITQLANAMILEMKWQI